jgi:hypothetical protein
MFKMYMDRAFEIVMHWDVLLMTASCQVMAGYLSICCALLLYHHCIAGHHCYWL